MVVEQLIRSASNMYMIQNWFHCHKPILQYMLKNDEQNSRQKVAKVMEK